MIEEKQTGAIQGSKKINSAKQIGLPKKINVPERMRCSNLDTVGS